MEIHDRRAVGEVLLDSRHDCGRGGAPATGVESLDPHPRTLIEMGDGAIHLEPLERPRALQLRIVTTRRGIPTHGAETVAIMGSPLADATQPAIVMTEQDAPRLMPLEDRLEVTILDAAGDMIREIEPDLLRWISKIMPQGGQQRTEIIALGLQEPLEQEIRPKRHPAPEIELILEKKIQRLAQFARTFPLERGVKLVDRELPGPRMQRIERIRQGEHQRDESIPCGSRLL